MEKQFLPADEISINTQSNNIEMTTQFIKLPENHNNNLILLKIR